MPLDLTRFGLPEMLRCGNVLRTSTAECKTLESAARTVCRCLYDELVSPTGDRACALVRCYKTHRFGDLPAELREIAAAGLGAKQWPAPEMNCLTLVATVGDEPAWNDRRRSAGHRVIPLPTSAMVERAPMIAALFKGLGVDVASLLTANRDVVSDLGGKSYGVFFVDDARGSPHIPAQDFVTRYGIRSVVGFGGTLQNGDLFAIIMFCKVAVPRESADRFRTIALDLKSRFFFFGEDHVFEGARPGTANAR